MYDRSPFLGQVRLVMADMPIPTPADRIPPGTSPLDPPKKVDWIGAVFGAGILAAIGTAAYAIFR